MISSHRRAGTRPAPGSRVVVPFALVAAIACVALWAGTADAPAVDTPVSTSRAVDAPLPSGPTPDLDLLFTAQVAGWVEPCG